MRGSPRLYTHTDARIRYNKTKIKLIYHIINGSNIEVQK